MRIISGSARGTNLYTLEGNDTRPTLDRVKESLFNILNKKIVDAYVLDLFSGSGAIGLECASRGAKKVVLCDNSKQAINIIKKNVDKTKLNNSIELIKGESISLLDNFEKERFDIIFIDPPYNSKLASEAVKKIFEKNLLSSEGIIIVETDELERIISEI